MEETLDVEGEEGLEWSESSESFLGLSITIIIG